MTKAEFVAFCKGHDPDVMDFKARLQSRFTSVKRAFQKLDTSLDSFIDLSEFQAFCVEALGYTDPDLVKRIFQAIDDDHNAVISKAEFLALFGSKGEVGVVAEFREAIKKQFRSTVEAFDALGGSDDGLIGRDEFLDFLRDRNLLEDMPKELIEQLFCLIDENSDGYISKNEFRAVFITNSVKVLEFREALRSKYKTRSAAFEKLGGKDNGEIDMEEFHKRIAGDFGLRNRTENEQLFRMISGGDGIITRSEFKKFFLISSGNGSISGADNLRKSRSATSITDAEPTTYRSTRGSSFSTDAEPTSRSRFTSGNSTSRSSA